MFFVALVWGLTFWTTDWAPTLGTHWALYPPMLIASVLSTYKWIVLFMACWDSVLHGGQPQGGKKWIGVLGGMILHILAYILSIYVLPVDHPFFVLLALLACLIPAPVKPSEPGTK